MALYNNSYEVYTTDAEGKIGRSKGTNRKEMIYRLKIDIEMTNIMVENGELPATEKIIEASLHDYKYGNNRKWIVLENGKLKTVISDN